MPFSLLVSTSFRLGALALNFFYALVFHSPRIGKAPEIIHRFGKQLVVGRVASIAGQMANQAGLHQLLRRTARRIQKAPVYTVRRYLQFTASRNETARNIDVLLDFTASLRVGDYDLETLTLQIVNHEFPIEWQGALGKFQ